MHRKKAVSGLGRGCAACMFNPLRTYPQLQGTKTSCSRWAEHPTKEIELKHWECCHVYSGLRTCQRSCCLLESTKRGKRRPDHRQICCEPGRSCPAQGGHCFQEGDGSGWLSRIPRRGDPLSIYCLKFGLKPGSPVSEPR